MSSDAINGENGAGWRKFCEGRDCMDDCLRPSTGGQRILVGAARLLERVGVVLS